MGARPSTFLLERAPTRSAFCTDGARPSHETARAGLLARRMAPRGPEPAREQWAATGTAGNSTAASRPAANSSAGLYRGTRRLLPATAATPAATARRARWTTAPVPAKPAAPAAPTATATAGGRTPLTSDVYRD